MGTTSMSPSAMNDFFSGGYSVLPVTPKGRDQNMSVTSLPEMTMASGFTGPVSKGTAPGMSG
jgi:hypothetical protein